MPSRLARFLSLLLLLSAAAQAQNPPGSAETGPHAAPLPSVRNEVVVGITGPFDPDARATIVRLLRAELEPQGLVLVETDPRGEARDWAHEVTKSERHLLGVLLDTRARSNWRLVVIDSARGRAISRELPRGEDDPANVEAVVSIVLSATSALREGLEVASAPVEAVVEPVAPPAPPAPPKKKAPPAPPLPRARAGTTLHASLIAEGSSFAEGAEPSFGASFAAGASLFSILDVELAATRSLAQSVESEFGSFELDRTGLVLSVGPAFRSRSFVFVPALGFATEWIARGNTRAASGVGSGDDEATTLRFGAHLELRGRYRLLSSGDAELLSLVAVAGASYFDERVRFLAGDEVIAEVRRGAVHAGLGLFIATGSL
ncbi:MAG TPA: hypothetical protein VMS65_07045 [Polyangiaceae bacterium]|nr:hypothetical protein [Polyangiaceae bacterium]